MDMEQFFLELTRYLNTESGIQLLQCFVGCIAGAMFICIVFYDFLKGCAIVFFDSVFDMARWVYKHTKYYKKKHEKALAAYDSCETIVQQLWSEDMIDHDQYTVFLDSLEEYMDKRTRGTGSWRR